MKFLKYLNNNYWCKLFFLIIPFLNEIPLVMPYTNSLLKFGLVLAVIYLVADLLTDRQTLRIEGITAILFFLAAGLIGCVLNIHSEKAGMNIISFFYNVCTLLVLFPVSRKKDAKQIQKEFLYINSILLVMTSVVALISLVMFFGKIQIKFTYNSYVYCMGYNSGRLVGLLRNAIYPTFAIGIFCALIQLSVRNDGKKGSKWLTVLLWISVAVNFVALILQQSKGLAIGMYCAAFFVALLWMYHVKRLPGCVKHLPNGARLALGVPAGVVAAGAILGLEKAVFFCTEKIVTAITLLTVPAKPGENKPTIDQVIGEVDDFIGREEISESYGAMTGRPYVWGKGISWFTKKPLFGYGSHTLADAVHPYEGSNEQLTHFHNIFIQTLVSYGVIGFLGFALLVLQVVMKLLRKLFSDVLGEDRLTLILSTAMIVFLFVINMADTTILFMFKQSGFVFFMYLGYLMYACDESVSFADKPVWNLAQWIDRKVSNAK